MTLHVQLVISAVCFLPLAFKKVEKHAGGRINLPCYINFQLRLFQIFGFTLNRFDSKHLIVVMTGFHSMKFSII